MSIIARNYIFSGTKGISAGVQFPWSRINANYSVAVNWCRQTYLYSVAVTIKLSIISNKFFTMRCSPNREGGNFKGGFMEILVVIKWLYITMWFCLLGALALGGVYLMFQRGNKV